MKTTLEIKEAVLRSDAQTANVLIGILQGPQGLALGRAIRGLVNPPRNTFAVDVSALIDTYLSKHHKDLTS